MKRCVLVYFLFITAVGAYGQRNFSLSAGGSFNFAAKGLGLNDGGLGFHVQGNLFAAHPLQLRIEAGLDKFLGDKQLEIDINGNSYERNPTITKVLSGAEYFLNKDLSLAALYGVVWNNWRNNTKVQGGLKFLVAGHLGKRQRFTPALFYTVLPGDGIHYLSLNVGCRLY